VARAETRTKLPLDRWAALMGMDPTHFNGVYVPSAEPTVCEQPWLQFAWQAANRVGREEVAEAIASAEANLERYLRYRLLPSWEEDEWHETIRPLRKDLFNLTSTGIRGFAQPVQANWGYLLSGGTRQKDLIGQGDNAIDFTDVDGDVEYEEVATVTGGVTVPAGTDPCEIHVYFPASNAMVAAGGEDQWEIKPINVTVVGTLATITFRREQCVLPELQLRIVPDAVDSHQRGVDGGLAGDVNFLTAVDVYRVYNAPQPQVNLLWEGLGIGCACNGSGCNMCEYSTQTGCLTARGDLRQSIVAYRPATWNAATASFDSDLLTVERQPDSVRLWYRAGWRDMSRDCPTVQMDPELERIVAYMAAARLDRPVCECNNVHAWIERWKRDLAVTGEDAESFAVKMSPADLDNPFGTKRGEIFAWRRVNREGTKIGRAVHV